MLGPLLDAITAGLELAKRDPEAQRMATEWRTDKRRAGRLREAAIARHNALLAAEGLDASAANDKARAKVVRANESAPRWRWEILERRAEKSRRAAERERGRAHGLTLEILTLAPPELIDLARRFVDAAEAA